MNAWLNGTSDLLVHFFCRESPQETYTVIALCTLLGALALSRVSNGLGAMRAFYTSGILLVPAGLVILVAALALAPVFGLHGSWFPLGMAVLVLLILVLPLTVLLLRGGYVTMLVAWTVTLLTVGVVLTMEPELKQSAEGLKDRLIHGRLFEQSHTNLETYK